jgi:hypothetical protein
MIGIALLITAGSFLVALVYLRVRIWLMSRRPQLERPRLERPGPRQ